MDFEEREPKGTGDAPMESPAPEVDELVKLHLARSVGLERQSDIVKYQDQIDRLMEWAREKGAKNKEEMVWQVRQLANRIGGPTIGTNWVRHLANYAYLEMEKLKIDKQLQELEGKK